MNETLYVQVILPLRLDWEPWYSTTDIVVPGSRVTVIFAHRRYAGVVHRVSEVAPSGIRKISPVEGVAEGMSDITAEEIEFWEFISSYYLCSIGEVYKAAYPYQKIRSEETSLHQAERLQARLEHLSSEIERRSASKRAKPEVTETLVRKRDSLSVLLSGLRGAGVLPPVKGEFTKPEVIIGQSRDSLYSEALQRCLADGRSALVLAPDFIGADILQERLGDGFCDILLCTSRETAVRRREIAGILRKDANPHIVLGTRSALFLPFRNLGLVIVDDEQDSSYKQAEPAPRYNGRDCAVKLAQIFGARVLLGSAFPSLETQLNCLSGKFTMTECGGTVEYNTKIVDVSAEKRKNGMKGAFSRILLSEIADTQGEVILIRGWEKPEEIQDAITGFFPERMIRVLKYKEARETDLSKAGLVAVLQADALIPKDDFRADEKAAHLKLALSSRCRRLIVQTSVPERFNGTRSVEDLLAERREFGYPPYTRLVEILNRDTGKVEKRVFLKRDGQLASRKEALRSSVGAGEIIDVDPLT